MSKGATTQRKDEILQAAIELIASGGYVDLNMRAVASAADMSLSDLQHHFRTWEDLLPALVDSIREEYDRAFEELANSTRSRRPREAVRIMVYETPGDATLQVDRLFPQLWAMAQDEPVIQELLDETYGRYLDMLERAFVEAGNRAPRGAARRAGHEALLEVAKQSGVFRSEAQLLVFGKRVERSAHRADRADRDDVVL